MINLMRNVLLNISAVTQEAEIAGEFQHLIPSGFAPLTYSASTDRVRVALLPGLTLDDKAFATSKVLQLLYSHPVQVYLRALNNVFTFDPLGSDENFNDERIYDLVSVDSRVTFALSQSKFLQETRRTVDQAVWLGLERIRSTAKGPLDRVASVATMFELHAGKLAGQVNGS